MHHVITRAPKGLDVFRCQEDFAFYLDLLGDEVRERGWSLLTYCLMTTHVHLLTLTPEPDLGDGLKSIHEQFVRAMHARREGHGQLLGRFKNPQVTTEEHAIACLRYIARNPVKARLCDRPDQWRWSAHCALSGLEPAHAWLDLAAVRALVGQRAYRELAEMPDRALLSRLAAGGSSTWIARAVDHHRIPISNVAEQLGVHATTAYRRLRAARLLLEGQAPQ